MLYPTGVLHKESILPGWCEGRSGGGTPGIALTIGSMYNHLENSWKGLSRRVLVRQGNKFGIAY